MTTVPATVTPNPSPIPADWIITDPSTWTLTTTVDAHLGYHKTGMVVRELREIRHSATDLDYANDSEPTAECAEWWANVLIPIHDAAVAVAEASPEDLDAVREALDAYNDQDEDLEYHAATARTLADLLTTERRRRIVPLLEDNSPTTSAPLTPTEQLTDALACVRYLAKIIREDGNWKDDEPFALDWADRIAGLYEQQNGEGNWGPGVGDEAILAVTAQTLDQNAAAVDDLTDLDLDQTPALTANQGARVRVVEIGTDPDDEWRWTGYSVVTLDGPTPGTNLWVNVRDLARPTEAAR